MKAQESCIISQLSRVVDNLNV